jgi:uncharacterized protein YjaZ
MVFMGSEIAAGSPSVDVSEFPNPWLQNVFKDMTPDYFIPLAAHEYVHTQQPTFGNDLLSVSIQEGAADFISELTMGTALSTWYIKYGNAHEQELKEQFKKEMFGDKVARWLYNGADAKGTPGDLGYFMGYAICKSYYQQAKDKPAAIQDIIQLHTSDTTAVLQFLERSGYYSEPIDRQALKKETGPPL